jgi:uncharacterized protein (DUF1330 family)
VRAALVAALALAACATTPAATTPTATTPKGYIVAELVVTDVAAYGEYAKAVTAVVAQYGGRYLVRGGASEGKEGAPPSGRTVVIEFASLAEAQRFYASAEYAAIAPLRARAATSRVFLVEGVR